MIIQHKQKIKKEPYMQLTREHASTIFKIQTRMLDIKNNFRNKCNSSLNCRLCKTCMETQTHIHEECNSLDIIRKQHGLDKQPIERIPFCDSSMEVLCNVSKYVIKIMDLLKEST